MKIFLFLALLSVVGLFIPAEAQTAQRDPDYANAVNSAKECKTVVDQDETLSEAERVVKKKACARDAAKKIVNDYELKTTRQKELQIKNMIQCESWYDNYKITSEAKFKILKPQELAEDCIILYNDSIWNHKGLDRLEKLLDRANELGIFEITKIKAQIPEHGFSPLKQVELGVPKTLVDCKEGFVLIFKTTTKKPACFSLESADKILERGWGTLKL